MPSTTLRISSSLIALLVVAGCATVPTGPSVLVLPGTGKSFDQFRTDDLACKQFASEQLGGTTAASAAVNSGIKSAAVGTAVGAIAGAAINGSRGAGVGAGTGMVVGGVSGAGAADVSEYDMQRRYDFAYQQCMYAKGNRIPIAGGAASWQYQQSHGVSQQTNSPPPPPAGTPPPPPPDVLRSR
jgi:hypothetical protein